MMSRGPHSFRLGGAARGGPRRSSGSGVSSSLTGKIDQTHPAVESQMLRQNLKVNKVTGVSRVLGLTPSSLEREQRGRATHRRRLHATMVHLQSGHTQDDICTHPGLTLSELLHLDPPLGPQFVSAPGPVQLLNSPLQVPGKYHHPIRGLRTCSQQNPSGCLGSH